MQLTDTHSHIYLPEFKDDRDQMLARANQESVSRIYMPNIDHRTIDEMLELEANYPQQCFLQGVSSIFMVTEQRQQYSVCIRLNHQTEFFEGGSMAAPRLFKECMGYFFKPHTRGFACRISSFQQT